MGAPVEIGDGGVDGGRKDWGLVKRCWFSRLGL